MRQLELSDLGELGLLTCYDPVVVVLLGLGKALGVLEECRQKVAKGQVIDILLHAVLDLGLFPLFSTFLSTPLDVGVMTSTLLTRNVEELDVLGLDLIGEVQKAMKMPLAGSMELSADNALDGSELLTLEVVLDDLSGDGVLLLLDIEAGVGVGQKDAFPLEGESPFESFTRADFSFSFSFRNAASNFTGFVIIRFKVDTFFFSLKLIDIILSTHL